MSHKNSGLTSQDGQLPVALQSVHAQGRLNGLVLRMTLRQVYRNTAGNNLECVYTFPLAWGSVLLGMAVELNGKRMAGMVAQKQQAEARYEEAVQSGDLPVMLERSGKDLYSANLGNLQSGDEVVIELEYAQLLRLEQGTLQMRLPTTIAPRYGDEHAHGGLAPHQTAQASPQAEYRLTLSLEVSKPLAQGIIRSPSPSHPVQLLPGQTGVTVKLQNHAWLDRDFVLTVDGLKDQVFAVASADATQPGQYTLLCSAVAQWDADTRGAAPLRMKVLVDGSGSMQGDSNAQARDALDWLFHQLQADDQVALSRFGSETMHVLPMRHCTDSHQRQLRATARQIEADLGGTEMENALTAVIALKPEEGPRLETASILLITDGEVWAIEDIAATVRQSGHRVFALGVGSAPAESLLRELAEVSGGACELVSPNQSMQQAVARLLQHMRHSSAVDATLLCDADILRQTTGKRDITQGDTLHHWAQLNSRPNTAPRLQWSIDGKTYTHQAESLTWDEDGILPRLYAAQRLLDTTDHDQICALATQYQLITQHTNFILVHERAEVDKAQGLPLLQQVAQMPAAGTAGNGSVQMSFGHGLQDGHDLRFLRASAPPFGQIEHQYFESRVCLEISSASSALFDDYDIPAYLRKQPDAKVPQGKFQAFADALKTLKDASNPLTEILLNINAMAYGSRSLGQVFAVCLHPATHTFAEDFVRYLAQGRHNEHQVWAVLLIWLADTQGAALDRHARRALVAMTQSLSESAKSQILQSIEVAAEAQQVS